MQRQPPCAGPDFSCAMTTPQPRSRGIRAIVVRGQRQEADGLPDAATGTKQILQAERPVPMERGPAFWEGRMIGGPSAGMADVGG
jgi:hypothetical protein